MSTSPRKYYKTIIIWQIQAICKWPEHLPWNSCAKEVAVIQTAINDLAKCSRNRLIPLSAEETLHLRLASSSVPAMYNISSILIKRVKSVRDLVFHWSKALNFSAHYDTICQKAMSRTFQVFRAPSTDTYILLIANKMYVRPIVEWGSTLIKGSNHGDVRHCDISVTQGNLARWALL